MELLEKRYETYVEDLKAVYAAAGPTDGLFGWGDDPRKDPCHMRFYEDVQQWVKDFQGKGPSQQEVFAAVRYILETPAKYREQHCFWFMYAAHGLVRSLIPQLSREQCALLRTLYDDQFPKRDRMPVQKEVYKLLKKGAGQSLW